MSSVQCPNCQVFVSRGNLARHMRSKKCKCKGVYKSRAEIGKERVKCTRCSAEVCRNKLKRHQRTQKCRLAGFAFLEIKDDVVAPEDPEEVWQKIGIYSVSTHGRMRGPTGVHPPTKSSGGYMRFKSFWIHRLVAETFVQNPRPDIFDCVDHIDRNKENNCASNLRWVNQQLNQLNRADRNPENFNKVYNFLTGPDKPMPSFR